MTPHLSQALDRTKTSSRAAVYILSSAAFGMGLSPESMVLNRESIRQSRILHAEESTYHIQQNFESNSALVLHWDGKLLPKLDLNHKVDRIAIIVTGPKIVQTLGLPYLSESATGKSQAELIMQPIKKWHQVLNQIEFLCFDTTNVNSGRHKGTCQWLEKLMG